MAKTKGQVTTTKGPKDLKPIEEAIENKEAEEVVVVEENTLVTPITAEERDKLVEVYPHFSGRKFIAGRWYEFERDKKALVTEHVKKLLRDRKLIQI